MRQDNLLSKRKEHNTAKQVHCCQLEYIHIQFHSIFYLKLQLI